MVTFRTVKRKINAEIFPFAKLKEFVIKESAVRIYGEIQHEVAGNLPFVNSFGNKRLCNVDALVNSVLA